MTDTVRGPFIVIGENIHATRVLLRTGARVASLPDGRPALPFTDDDGSRAAPAGPATRPSRAPARSRRSSTSRPPSSPGLAGGADAALGRGYVRFLARRQAEAGADYLDLNVDEASNDVDGRVAAMRWLVGAVEDATPAALALDSSAPEVLAAGLAAAARSAGAPAPQLGVARAARRPGPRRGRGVRGRPRRQRRARHAGLGRGAGGERDRGSSRRRRAAGWRSARSTSTRWSCRSPSSRRSAPGSSRRSGRCARPTGRRST